MSLRLPPDLDPAVREWLRREAALSAAMPALDPTALDEHRAASVRRSDALATWSTAPAPADVEVQDLVLAGMRARRYATTRRAPCPLPTQLFLHGGGFFAGTIDEILNDRLCAARAASTGIQIVALEYRLAPEHRYPAQVDDAIAALDAMLAHPGLDVDPARLGIGGNSAGAAIAASTAIALRDRRDDRLLHQCLEVPPGALRPVGASARLLPPEELEVLTRLRHLYVGDADEVPSGASLLDVADLSGLPAALVMVAEHDPLRDSGIAYAERLEAAGVPVTLVVGAGHLHATLGHTAIFEGARAWQRRQDAELSAAYGTAL